MSTSGSDNEPGVVCDDEAGRDESLGSFASGECDADSGSDDSDEFQVISVHTDGDGAERSSMATDADGTHNDDNGNGHERINTTSLTDTQHDKLNRWILSSIEFEQKNKTSLCDIIRSNPRFSNPTTFDRMLNYCKVEPFRSHVSSIDDNDKVQQGMFYDDIVQLQQQQDQANSAQHNDR